MSKQLDLFTEEHFKNTPNKRRECMSNRYEVVVRCVEYKIVEVEGEDFSDVEEEAIKMCYENGVDEDADVKVTDISLIEEDVDEDEEEINDDEFGGGCCCGEEPVVETNKIETEEEQD